jgi:hypothetical protein
MPDQKYRLLCSEEDGEDISLQRNFSITAWNCGLDIKHLIINVIIFTAGLFVGLLLNTARPRGASDQLAQYSMVPCKFATP